MYTKGGVSSVHQMIGQNKTLTASKASRIQEIVFKKINVRPFRHKVETTYKQRANRKAQMQPRRRFEGKHRGGKARQLEKKSIISGVRKISEFPRLVFSAARS